MSEAYIRHAKRELKRWSWMTRFIVGKAEAIPLPDNGQDAVTGIFLFHELPGPGYDVPSFANVPGSLHPVGDWCSLTLLQRGDRPDYEGLLELFPQNYHEPYYETYTNEDFRALATDCGLAYIRTVNAFVSKVMVFDKPAP